VARSVGHARDRALHGCSGARGVHVALGRSIGALGPGDGPRVRDGNFIRECGYLTQWVRARAWVSFSPVGNSRISGISDFDGFNPINPSKFPSASKFWLSPTIPPLKSRIVTLGGVYLTYQPGSSLGAPIHRNFVIEFTSTLLKPVGVGFCQTRPVAIPTRGSLPRPANQRNGPTNHVPMRAARTPRPTILRVIFLS
jgi:hypothetical protein